MGGVGRESKGEEMEGVGRESKSEKTSGLEVPRRGGGWVCWVGSGAEERASGGSETVIINMKAEGREAFNSAGRRYSLQA